MSDAGITIEGREWIKIAVMDSKFVSLGHVVLVQDGVEYPIDATFDLSKVPPEHHVLATQMAFYGRVRVGMMGKAEIAELRSRPARTPRPSRWDRFRGWLKGIFS